MGRDDEVLAEIRERLRALVAARFTRVLTAAEVAEYEELCHEEGALLERQRTAVTHLADHRRLLDLRTERDRASW